MSWWINNPHTLTEVLGALGAIKQLWEASQQGTVVASSTIMGRVEATWGQGNLTITVSEPAVGEGG